MNTLAITRDETMPVAARLGLLDSMQRAYMRDLIMPMQDEIDYDTKLRRAGQRHWPIEWQRTLELAMLNSDRARTITQALSPTRFLAMSLVLRRQVALAHSFMHACIDSLDHGDIMSAFEHITKAHEQLTALLNRDAIQRRPDRSPASYAREFEILTTIENETMKVQMGLANLRAAA